MDDRDVDFKSFVQPMGETGADSGFVESQPFLFVKSIDKSKRQITALASSGTIDRDDEIIEPEAFRKMLPRYMKNPVVITSHQHRLQTGNSSVIGNVVKAWIDQQGLWVIIEFAAATSLGEEYWQLYSQKIQRAFSIGFIPIEHTYEARDGKRVRVHTVVELLEISCVAVPSNPDALSRSKRRKRDFVASKRAGRELALIRAEIPDFRLPTEKECIEFAEAILGIEGEGKATDDFGDTSDCDFAKIVNSENEGPYASMFR